MISHTTSCKFILRLEEFLQDFLQKEDRDEIQHSSHRTLEKVIVCEDNHMKEKPLETDF